MKGTANPLRLVVALCGVILLASGCGDRSAPDSSYATEAARSDPGVPRETPRTKVLETEVLPIDRIYHSMQGPFNRILVDHAGLDWVTAIRTEVVDAGDGAEMDGEFFCHSQLQLLNGTRLMVMATGADEIRFPPGFAMPVSEILDGIPADQRALTFLGMVLNNHEPRIDRQATVRATVDYYRDEDFGALPRPNKLFVTSLTMYVEDLEAYVPEPGIAPVNDDVTTHCALVGDLPQHWIVPPGQQKTRNRYQDFTPLNGRVHYAWAHLHNHAVYMRLTDVTAGEVLWQADVRHESDRDQIASISYYSSAEGFPIYRDHVYEIEALYDNDTDHDVDAMAMMVMYYQPEGNVSITYPHSPDEEPESRIR